MTALIFSCFLSGSHRPLTAQKRAKDSGLNERCPPRGSLGRGAIVELFGWPYDDIAKECEMLGKAGYMGVKIFPAQGILDLASDCRLIV